MRRTAFDERRDQQIADESGAGMLPCSFCGRQTEHAVLVEYGARCGPCFNAYVTRDRPVSRILTSDEKRAVLHRLRVLLSVQQHPRAWAHRLRDREDAGERLTRIQRDAWRTALNESENQESEA